MKYETVSLNTKRALSAALKEALKDKPLSKVSVSEIARRCGVNRKTFYYHFQGIYELVQWTLEQDAVEVVKQLDPLVHAEDAVSYALDYVETNQHMLSCVFDTIGRTEMRNFFYKDFIHMAADMIDRRETELGIRVDEQFKSFLAEFSTEALAGILINIMTGELKYDRKELQENIVLISQTMVPGILKAYAEHQGNEP